MATDNKYDRQLRLWGAHGQVLCRDTFAKVFNLPVETAGVVPTLLAECIPCWHRNLQEPSASWLRGDCCSGSK